MAGTKDRGKLLQMALRASSIIWSAVLGATRGCTIIRTSPGNSLDSCLLGILLPVPMSVTGTTGTPALAATLNAPCAATSHRPGGRGLGGMTLVSDEEPGIPLLTFLNSWMRMSVLRVPSGKNSTEAPCCRRSLQVERHLIWLRLSTLFKRTCPARCATSGQPLLEAYFLLTTGAPRTCEEHAPAHDWYKEIAGLRYELEWPIQMEKRVDVLHPPAARERYLRYVCIAELGHEGANS